MAVLIAICAILLILGVLWDAFETVILPRRVTRRLRLTSLVYRFTWGPYLMVARRIPHGSRRESFLSFYGPLALILLLMVWAGSLIMGFALLHWAFGSRLFDPDGSAGFGTDVYMSGTTFFTLGLGDVIPRTPGERVVTVIEAGMGFGILALVISYLPILYQAFSRREVNISLLDARAGSPPSAVELLRRYGQSGNIQGLENLLQSWETWAAELMESHLSYPSLAYFRSQHEHQSWVAGLATILDVCALVMVGVDGASTQPARLTFAMARHAAVDLSQIFYAHPDMNDPHNLRPVDIAALRAALAEAGVPLRDGEEANHKFEKLRGMYEPYVKALGDRLLMPLPPWIPPANAIDDWQTSVWQHADAMPV
ncbi:MAG TPA: potassium channel family protein [Ktedonobacterales bacterium]|nr:potassium channel family protein [Ktedonobacterales bacterium]